ncbi:hypothetical protein L210DRAFT_406997 [Boletus edulis BED1]|uniref:Uncharacterized protein n=1 Tax=Boletus edulis BED1 TaxID=1328754 RepID=A0AAD4BNH2_BOLED|nr:hypothetical protein L210DRAFT_406997 [Boletus edulis BED1]
MRKARSPPCTIYALHRAPSLSVSFPGEGIGGLERTIIKSLHESFIFAYVQDPASPR